MKANLYIGVKASVKRSFSSDEVRYYCRYVSQDTNPVHTDPVFAETTTFKNCIVPGLMTVSLFGGILGSSLPGKGTIYLGQTCKFILPVYVGEMIEATIELTGFREDKSIYTFKTLVYNSNSEEVVVGEAVVKYVGDQ